MQITVHHRNLSTVALQQGFATGRNDQLGELWCQKPFEAPSPLKFADLVLHALFERSAPLLELCRLLLHRVVQGLNTQHGLHSCDEGSLVDRLRQVFVCTRFETGDDIFGIAFRGHHDNGHIGNGRVGSELAADLDPVHFGHHDIEQQQIGLLRLGHVQGLFAIGCRQQFITVHGQPRLQDVHIHGLVIHDENTRRSLHKHPLRQEFADFGEQCKRAHRFRHIGIASGFGSLDVFTAEGV